ncbi:MAG TPA: Uma2 family endonuclease [Thermomicrobiales bacterium]|jgi:Uma2 family endonuclease|nr:Uma2 family endonuclease [Thermomicrobiales bacterium]
MVTTKLTTADELAEFPDDGYRYELIGGEVQRMAPAGGVHGEIGQELGWRLGAHVSSNDLGRVYLAETGFFLAENPDIVLAPDIAFLRSDRLPPREDRFGFIRVPPDLVVEVVSPHDRASDIAAKVALYLSLGVRAVWVIEPRLQTVTLYEVDHRPRILVSGDTLDGGEIVPDFHVAVADLFR